jgi:hypothetical protein
MAVLVENVSFSTGVRPLQTNISVVPNPISITATVLAANSLLSIDPS